MGFLAYDPARLGVLRRAITVALDELRTVRCTDAAATDAMRDVRRLADDLDVTWLPIVDRVIAGAAMEVSGSDRARFADLDNSLVWTMARGYGWSVAADPLQDDATVVTAEEARALGARLNRVDPASFVDDPVALTWLAGQLQIIGRDPDLTGQFLANFHEWGPWCDALGRQHAFVVDGIEYRAHAGVVELDGVLAGFAAVRGSLPVDSLVDQMHPYSAALLVGFMGLHGAELADVADRLIQRNWSDRMGDTDIPVADLDALDGPNTADLLCALMLLDPVACTHYIGLFVDHPDTVLVTIDDIELLHRVVLTGTDPANVDATTAGRLLPTLIDSYRSTYSTDANLFLVDLISPWLLQFSPANHEWALSSSERNSMLAFVLEDNTALEHLIENSGAVTAGVIASLTSGTPHQLEELAAFVAMLGDLVVNERVRSEQLRKSAWDMVCGIAGLLTVAIPGIAASLGVAAALLVVQSSFGPDPDHARHIAAYGSDLALTTAAAAVADRMVAQMTTEGRLPPGFPSPPDADPSVVQPSDLFIQEFMDWCDHLPGGPHGQVADTIVRHVYTVLNPAVMGANSVD